MGLPACACRGRFKYHGYYTAYQRYASFQLFSSQVTRKDNQAQKGRLLFSSMSQTTEETLDNAPTDPPPVLQLETLVQTVAERVVQHLSENSTATAGLPQSTSGKLPYSLGLGAY